MIFNLFKSKPTLQDLIPEGFVDIHSHILPGIDDGAKNLKDSLYLISKMEKMGFSKIVATPHTYHGLYNNSNKSIADAFNKLKINLKSNIEVTYASEYMIDNSLIDRAKKKDLLCVRDNYVLIEMSYLSAPNNLYEVIYELKVNGYFPIMAHPERYYFLHNNFKEYQKLKKFGCFFQINLLSATGYYGSEVSSCLDKLFSTGLVDFVGSDIHKDLHINGFERKVRIKNKKLLEKCIIRNNEVFGPV